MNPVTTQEAAFMNTISPETLLARILENLNIAVPPVRTSPQNSSSANHDAAMDEEEVEELSSFPEYGSEYQSLTGSKFMCTE